MFIYSVDIFVATSMDASVQQHRHFCRQGVWTYFLRIRLRLVLTHEVARGFQERTKRLGGLGLQALQRVHLRFGQSRFKLVGQRKLLFRLDEHFIHRIWSGFPQLVQGWPSCLQSVHERRFRD